MAELEAIFIEQDSQIRQGWRYPLPVNKPIRFGRIPGESEWVMESDPIISGCHAILTWNGQQLSVRESENPVPRNRGVLLFQQKSQRAFSVSPGEEFSIGSTRFKLHGAPVAPVDDGQQPRFEKTFSLEELKLERHSRSAAAKITLDILEDAARAVRMARSDGSVRLQLLRVLLDALPWLDAAGVVSAPSSTSRIEIRENVIRNGRNDESYSFVPSRRLVGKTLAEKRNCLHVWLSSEADSVTIGPGARPGQIPWAVCLPFPAIKGCTLYAAGTMPHDILPAGQDPTPQLLEYQRVLQSVAQLLEARSIGFKLADQVHMLKDFCPRPIRPYLEDANAVKNLFSPRQVEATILFCDLRGFTRMSEQGGSTLLDTWEKLRTPVHEMSSAITLHEGIVAGFQGDAVLGFWGWPKSQPDQIRKASQAAIRINEVMTEWLKGFHCGIGLTHGTVVAGRLGALDLAKVDVFGPPVNLASRLEGLTKVFGVPILTDGVVAEAITQWVAENPGATTPTTRQLAQVVPKGMTAAVKVCELIPADTQRWSDPGHLYEWELVVDRFLNGEWAEAYRDLQNNFADDPTARYLMEFMNPNNKTPAAKLRPPEDWDAKGRAIWMAEK